MSHDATKIAMGSTQSSSKQGSEDFNSDPTTYLAGLAVRRASTGLLSLVKSAGGWVGISLGKSLSDVLKTTVLRAGERVPVLLERQPARGVITITDYAALVSGTDDAVIVGDTTFTAQSGAVTPGDATFQAATGNTETAASLAAQINAHAVSSLLVKATSALGVVTITALSNAADADTIVLGYTDNDTNVGATKSGTTLTDSDDTADWVVIGAKVYFSDTTGKADDPNSGATISDAVYVSAPMTGIGEDGVEVAVALVDMPGGL
jgi:hypothetical protein